MNTLLANTAIEIAIAGCIGAAGSVLLALANLLNARARLLEHTLQIADLQRQTMHLAAMQQAPQPTIITLPQAPAPASALTPGAGATQAAGS